MNSGQQKIEVSQRFFYTFMNVRTRFSRLDSRHHTWMETGQILTGVVPWVVIKVEVVWRDAQCRILLPIHEKGLLETVQLRMLKRIDRISFLKQCTNIIIVFLTHYIIGSDYFLKNVILFLHSYNTLF